MVARILVGTTMSVITRMDNPKWFKENAEPYVFSRARYEKTVEDLKALGAQDPNATEALVRNVSFRCHSAYSTCARKGTFSGRLKRPSTRSMRRLCSR